MLTTMAQTRCLIASFYAVKAVCLPLMLLTSFRKHDLVDFTVMLFSINFFSKPNNMLDISVPKNLLDEPKQ